MKVKIVRERRKTMVLSLLDEDNALLKVPKNLSDSKVSEFLDGKRKWLEDKSRKLKQSKEFSNTFDLRNSFYLFDSNEGDFKNLIMGFDKLSEKQKGVQIKKFYLSHFSNLEVLAYDLSRKTGFVFDGVKPTNAKTIWGSYSSAKIMKLNWRLLMLPKPLVEYVIYHELCHSKHMNHKPQFWKEVAKLCPDYKTRRKQLNQYGFLLKADF